MIPDMPDISFLVFIKTTYPVSFIVVMLTGFGASIAGFARRAYFKNQDKLIESLENEIERLTSDYRA